MNNKFKIYSNNTPAGSQPEAIEKLVQGINDGIDSQILLGVTGSGKTFTIANVIEKVQKPTLVIAHNKTLAAQLYSEFKEIFPENAVEYFISYYALVCGSRVYLSVSALGHSQSAFSSSPTGV